MGRTIPSFRVLIDIEKLEWKQFRKYLCRQDKKKSLTNYSPFQNYIVILYPI
jgi:hypothetical protein